MVNSLAGPFEAERYQDEYQKKLLDLIEVKSEGKHLGVTPQKKLAPVIDLMQALQRSLSEAEKGKDLQRNAEKIPALKVRSKRAVTKRAAS